MRYVGAIVSFAVAYPVVSILYGELMPEVVHDYFRRRPASLGFVTLVACLIVGAAVFRLLS